jgi:hypothetical protein
MRRPFRVKQGSAFGVPSNHPFDGRHASLKREERVTAIRIRTVAKPDKDVAMLPSQPDLQLPNASKQVQNLVEKRARLFRNSLIKSK